MAVAAGSVAAGGGIAAVGAGIMAGSLSAIAIGVSVVGSALSLVGQMTGSKTLGKIGLGLSVAGGVGSFAARGATSAASLAANTEGAVAARASDLSTTEGLLASKTRGMKDVIANNAFKAFNPGNNSSMLDSASSFKDSVGTIGNYATEPSVFERFNSSMTKYNGAMNIAGGVGDAYMKNQQTAAYINQRNKDREFEREVSDRNYAGTAGSMPQRNVSFNPTSQSLLRGNTTIPNIIPQR